MKTNTINTKPVAALDPAQVLRVSQWIELSGLGTDYAWRLLRSGKGPRLLKLSERRLGVKVADHNTWVEACAKAAHDDPEMKANRQANGAWRRNPDRAA
jgi:predicted DNA-binding transcriptional regulator AlpA